LEKDAMRKSLEWWGKYKRERKTHPCCLLHVTCEWGMAVVGFYSPCQLREGKGHHGWNNNSIENAVVRIMGNGGENIKTTG